MSPDPVVDLVRATVALFIIVDPTGLVPGSITTTMIALGAYGILVTLGSVLIVMLLSWIVMKQTPRIHSLLGKTGSSVIAQVMAVFIAAIAIQFIITGIRTYP